MAKFNEKALCLFYKTYDQLKKEAERRGMRHEGREKTIAKIIWKDAYDAGVIEGKNQSVRSCPVNCCGNAEPEVRAYCLHDIDGDKKYRLELTEDQASAIDWMIDNELVIGVEFSEWDDTFENIGRI